MTVKSVIGLFKLYNDIMYVNRKTYDNINTVAEMVDILINSKFQKIDEMTEKEKQYRRELARKNRRDKIMEIIEVQDYLFDYELIQSKDDRTRAWIEDEIMEGNPIITRREVEDYIQSAIVLLSNKGRSVGD